jgi:spore maturation protein CgeB
MNIGLKISFLGSSLVSAYWNGAATYYRGIINALYHRGHEVTFYEPDIYDRQKHRDIPDPPWARVVVYKAEQPEDLLPVLDDAKQADVIIKASGIGRFDSELEEAVLNLRRLNNMVIFWDVDAPATLDRVHMNPDDPFLSLIPRYDMILTYGGGEPVVETYKNLGARECCPIYNALDPTTHYQVRPDPRFIGDLAFCGNRLPDREQRVEDFFLKTAQTLPNKSFLLGGSGWQDKKIPGNIKYIGHIYTQDHNAFNCTPRCILNISRESMARYGFSPATRLFEAAGAGACLITDYWQGIDHFLEPGNEILVAHNGREVTTHLSELTSERAHQIGQAAQRRILAEHTYRHRVKKLEELLNINSTSRRK